MTSRRFALFAYTAPYWEFPLAFAQLLLDGVHYLIRQLLGLASAEEHAAVLCDLLLLERRCPILCASMRHRPLLVAHVAPSFREEAAASRIAAISPPPA